MCIGVTTTVYREIHALINFCEFREFWQIAKFSFAKFHNVGVACCANKRDREMALFRYFSPEEKQENPFLPDPTGPLSFVVPSSPIEAANNAVKRVLDDGEAYRQRTDRARFLALLSNSVFLAN